MGRWTRRLVEDERETIHSVCSSCDIARRAQGVRLRGQRMQLWQAWGLATV